MSDAIDYIALQKSKTIQYMIAQILDESRIKNLSPADTVELAIIRGMECQKKLDERWEELCREEYISFTVARYALTDVIEELTAAKVKDIIVTKVDDNLVVKYKPSWRK